MSNRDAVCGGSAPESWYAASVDAAAEGSEPAAVRTLPLRAPRVKCRQKDVAMRNIERSHPEQRPPIVLTAMDRETLFALLGDPLKTMDMEAACFLREEIERADIVPDDVAPNSVVRLGCDVKFVDHADARIRRARTRFSGRGSMQSLYFSLKSRRKCADRSWTGAVDPLDGAR